MGREKGARENIFPCLLGEKMGEERKWGRKIVWAPAPFSPQLFTPKMGGFWDNLFCSHSLPYCFSHGPTLLLTKLSSSSTLFFHSASQLSFTVQQYSSSTLFYKARELLPFHIFPVHERYKVLMRLAHNSFNSYSLHEIHERN